MKVVILAGGFGLRLSEETKFVPKPLVKIGSKPIIWHIMKIFAHYGINDFIVCLGYKGKMIKEYFENLSEKWNVNCVQTGLKTPTGGRLLLIKKYLKNERFILTYGDTLNNLNIDELIKFHKKHRRIATVTACHPKEKFGILSINKNLVNHFMEKPQRKDWVNGGFFVLESDIFQYIDSLNSTWEIDPIKKLIKNKQLSAFKHDGFYQPMDTIHEKNMLEKMWKENAPWRVWE